MLDPGVGIRDRVPGTGTEIGDSRDLLDPAKKSGIETGTQNQQIRDSGPGLKIEKSGIGDWNRD